MKYSLLPLVALISLASCQKNILTKEVKFTSTTYETLASYDSLGLPANLLPPDNISSDFRNFISGTFPEHTDIGIASPNLLDSKAIADIAITDPSTVFVTFLSHGASASNSFGFYTYPTNAPPTSPNDIKTITIVFPNAGAGSRLRPGDKVKLGTFGTGTSIGFVLLYGGWDPATKKLNNNAVHYLSNDVLNPEVSANLKKHAVLVNYPKENKTIIGFEDINRTQGSDNDFNDLLVYTSISK